jgi:hypothetical protein
MKYIFLLFFIILISGCKDDTAQETSGQKVSVSEVAQLSQSSNVYTSSVLADGTILFGGENGLSISSTSNRNNKSNFKLPVFTIKSDVNSSNRDNNDSVEKVKIYSIASLDNSIFIGGSFSNVNGIDRSNLIKLDNNGSVNIDFNNSINGTVFKILPIDTQSLLIAGAFGGYNDNIAHSIVKISTDGIINNDFVPFNEYLFVKINDIAKLDSNKYIVSGTFVKEAGEADENTTKEEVINMTHSVVVLNLDGSVDEDMTNKFSEIKNEAFVVEVDNGLVYIGGDFEFTKNGKLYNNLVSFHTDGSFNEDFKIDKLQGMIFDTKIMENQIIFVGDFIMDDNVQTRSFYIVDEYGRTIKIDNFSVDADIYSIDIYQGNLILSGDGKFELNGNSYSNNIALKLQ